MNLKSLCLDNIAQQIKKLPPMLQDEILNETTKSIRKEAEKKARKKIMKEILHSTTIVEDITDRMIESYKTGNIWKRPEYTHNIDDDLYNIFVNISEKFVTNNAEKLVFNGSRTHRRHSESVLWGDSSEEYSSDEY